MTVATVIGQVKHKNNRKTAVCCSCSQPLFYLRDPPIVTLISAFYDTLCTWPMMSTVAAVSTKYKPERAPQRFQTGCD